MTDHASHAKESVKDPVCGMTVEPTHSAAQAVHDGETYYFCSAGCHAKFTAHPQQFVTRSNGAEAKAVAAPEGAIWTCPMHPEIQRPGPGSCPICGMALEPVMPTANEGPSPEYRDMLRRFWIGLVLTLPVFALEMGGHLTGLHQWLERQTGNWIQMALATPVVLWAGWPFFERAWMSLKTRSLNMFTLIAMGTGVAWAYSMVAVLAPQIFPAGVVR